MRDDGAFRDEVKRALDDAERVCSALGLMERARRDTSGGYHVLCPAHVENTGSCHVRRGPDGTLQVTCFGGCGLSGDVFTLIAAAERLDVKRDFPKVLERAAALAGMEMPMREERPAFSRPAPTSQASRPLFVPPGVARQGGPAGGAEAVQDLTTAWDTLPPLDAEGWEYLKGRGLADAADLCRTATPTSSGQFGSFARSGFVLAMALRDGAGRVVAVQLRQITGKDFRMIGPSNGGVFGGDPRELDKAETVVLAEGMTDTLAASIATRGEPGFLVLGVPGVKAAAGFLGLPLAGKRVLVATDADQAGDAAAKDITLALEKKRARPMRARPAKAKDLAEMLVTGRNLLAFFRAAIQSEPRFVNFAERLRGERDERLEQRSRFCHWGVDFLQRAMGPIFPKDLILLGASSGVGKTEIARLISQANAANGKRVHYFALEAERNEIERRAKFSILSDMIRKMNPGHFERMNYLDWYAGNLEEATSRYEPAVEKVLAETYRTLFTFYRGRDFTADTLEQKILEIQDETDLIIIDHFHYIDTREDEDEWRGQKAIMKRIADLKDGIGKPVILVAHLRKETNPRHRPLVPELDDFHGSSDIAKIATGAVMLARADDHPTGVNYRFNTYFNLTKRRQDGARTRFAGLVPFDRRLNAYDRDFQVGRFIKARTEFQIIPPAEWPHWFKHEDKPQ